MGFRRILKNALIASSNERAQAGGSARRVLNVGGNNKKIPIPDCYSGWDHLLLDIDPRGKPDIVCDARNLHSLEGAQFDAVYCSHNLEHYYKHDCSKVLAGFLHVLKQDGFADIRVPDMMALMKRVGENDLDIEDVIYVAPGGPITVRDVIYGWSKEIERSGQDFYAHKTGFSDRSLTSALEQAGFGQVFPYLAPDILELRAIAFKTEASEPHWQLLGLPH
jgi:hypothetical protein